MDTYLSKKIKVISFISIIMVVYLHAYNLSVDFLGSSQSVKKADLNSFVQIFISNGITRVAVPLFFAISGYLFFINFKPTFLNFASKYKKRFFSLFIPFLFWSVWGIAFFYIMQSLPFARTFFSQDPVHNYDIGRILETVFIYPIPYQLWFVADLMKYVLISPIIYFYVSKCTYYSLIPFFILWFFNVDLIILSNEGILFFLLGSLLATKGIRKEGEISIKLSYALLISWLACLLLRTFSEMKGLEQTGYIHKVCVGLGVVAVWYFYDTWFKKTDIDTKILNFTSYTFFIYAAHEPILTIFKKGILKIIGVSPAGNLFAYAAAPLLTIVSILILGYMMKSFLNPLYSVITGGRKG